MVVLKKNKEGLDILCFSIGKFSFRWFTDCGQWFIYFERNINGEIVGHRFSSDGYMKLY